MTEIGRMTFDAFGSVTSAQGPTGPAGSIGATGATGPEGPAGADGGAGGGSSNEGFYGHEEFLYLPNGLTDNGWFGGPLNLRLRLSGANTVLDISAATSNRIGVALLGTGTTSTGYAHLISYSGGIPLQYGAITWETKINLNAASSGSQRYTVRCGIAVPSSGSAPTMGLWFSYCDNVNSGKYQAHITTPSGDTAYDTGVTATTGSSAWEKLGFEVTTTGGVDNFGQVIFKVNGTATNTLDIGDNGDIPEVDWYDDTMRGGIFMQIAKSVGSSDSYLGVDYINFSSVPTTAR